MDHQNQLINAAMQNSNAYLQSLETQTVPEQLLEAWKSERFMNVIFSLTTAAMLVQSQCYNLLLAHPNMSNHQQFVQLLGHVNQWMSVVVRPIQSSGRDFTNQCIVYNQAQTVGAMCDARNKMYAICVSTPPTPSTV
jgi:hypothetical protein